LRNTALEIFTALEGKPLEQRAVHELSTTVTFVVHNIQIASKISTYRRVSLTLPIDSSNSGGLLLALTLAHVSG
jgi:hypothetical protein